MTMPKDWGLKAPKLRNREGDLTADGLKAGYVEQHTYVSECEQYDVVATLRFIARPLQLFRASLVYWDGRTYQTAAVFEHTNLVPARDAYKGYVRAITPFT